MDIYLVHIAKINRNASNQEYIRLGKKYTLKEFEDKANNDELDLRCFYFRFI